ncbi:hypothetical protein DSTSK_22860 [Desulforhabdus sp. TSK]|nr:hypothetical protein DSTSK_22860 [Desulforhabdus sp. TSK]
MVILLLGLLGSIFGVMTAMNYNLENSLRNEAIIIAQEQLEKARNMKYADIESANFPSEVQRQVRKALRSFQVNTTVTTDTNLKRIKILVQWTSRKRLHKYSAETMVRELI